MSLRELAIRVLLISIVRFSTTSIIRPQRLYIVRVSPESARSLEHIPDKWRTVHLKFKAPQIEIQLMKGYVSSDENWMFATEYKYSGKDYKYVCKRDKKYIQRHARSGRDELAFRLASFIRTMK